MKFVAYYRVSTARQGESGLGLEAQRDQVKRYVDSVAGELVAEFTEVESGKRVTRPQLEAAIRAAQSAGATLIVAKLDRLARNARLVLKLRDSNLPLTFCDLPSPPDGAMGRFMIAQMALFAEFERDRISERTKAALAVAKSRGKKLGTYGRTLARRNRGAADAYARGVLRDAQAQGFDLLAMKHNDVQSTLNDANIFTRTGRAWSRTTTQRLLHRLRRLED